MLIRRTLKNAIVIPQRATFEILDKRYVYVVDKDDVVHQREIVVQNELEDIFVIKNGLGVDDKIVLEGVRQVRDGDKVEYEFRPPEAGCWQTKRTTRNSSRFPVTNTEPNRIRLRTMFTKILYRPALAIVISIILLFLGVLGIKTLPIAQFPDIAPPTVQVAIAYPGASANVLVDSVLIPLEQSINGVQNMRYMVSAATSAGEATIMIYFEPGTDPNINVVNVQNRVNIMLNRLPPLVVREGILVSQVVPSMLMYVNIYSTDPNADQKFLYNFANVNVMPEIKRIQGMGIPRNLGNRAFAMRVWLNPDRMRAYKMSTEDVMKALAEQSVIGSPGRLGQATGRTSQSREYVLTYVGRFNKPEQYENIILKANAEGEILRPQGRRRSRAGLRVLRHLLGHQRSSRGSIILKQSPGSNAAAVIEEIKKKLEEIKKESFPPGMDYELAYDVSNFLDASIEKVLHTLLEAFILVSLVVYMFLGDLRSTLIPTLAVPVSLVGTFFVLQVDRSVDQPDHALRDGAGDRGRGGRRDRGGRGGACQDGREAPFALSGDHGGASRDQRRDHRHHPGDDGRLRSGDVHSRAGRPLLPPVRHHDGHVHRSLRSGGPDADARALCDDSQAPHPRSHREGHVKKRCESEDILLYVLGGLLVLAPITYLAYYLWGPVGFLFLLLPLRAECFDRLVEKVTGGYAAILRRIVTRRTLTMVVVGGFAVGIVVVNTQLPTGFIRARTRASSTQSSRRLRARRSSTPTPSPRSSRRSPRRSKKSPPSPRWPVTRF